MVGSIDRCGPSLVIASSGSLKDRIAVAILQRYVDPVPSTLLIPTTGALGMYRPACEQRLVRGEKTAHDRHPTGACTPPKGLPYESGEWRVYRTQHSIPSR